MEIEIERIKIDNRWALIYDDVANHLVTIIFDGEGGPIVSAPTRAEAAQKFTEAMNLAEAVRKLNEFKHGMSFGG